MNGQVIRLGPGACSNIETGARFFSALAFPGKHEEAVRWNAVAAWVGQALHALNRCEETADPFTDPFLNLFAAQSPEWCEETLKTAPRRLRDRSDLARALRPWMRDMLG